MLVSIVIPACGAQSTIARAVRSLISQTWRAWEAIIVADDGRDYAEILARQGISDDRLRFASTGKIRFGCHNARNIGFSFARGDLIGTLDADDLFYPDRLAALAPLAADYGAAVDNMAVVSEETEAELYRVIGSSEKAVRFDVESFLRLTAPLFPLVRLDIAELRLQGIEYAEDVVANLRLIDRLGHLLVVPDTLSEYRVLIGSLCHSTNSAAAFDLTYANLIDRLQDPDDGLGLRPATRGAARKGLIAKRLLNSAFDKAWRSTPALDFQTFAAAQGQQARMIDLSMQDG
jgi:succinoglycan biosynthesis protein ExoO